MGWHQFEALEEFTIKYLGSELANGKNDWVDKQRLNVVENKA
jgi:hypothetical protein